MARGAASRLVLVAALALLGTLVLLALPALGNDYHYDNVQLTGVHRDKVIEVWGVVTVPANSSLVLQNVTLLFHKENVSSCGIRMEAGSSLEVQDGDDDPDTTEDASTVAATGGAWFIYGVDARRFSVGNSALVNVSVTWRDPWSGMYMGSRINADLIDIDHASVLVGPQDLTLLGGIVNITGSTVRTIAGARSLNLRGDRVQVLDSTLTLYSPRLDGVVVVIRRSQITGAYLMIDDAGTVQMDRCVFNGPMIRTRDVDRLSIKDSAFESSGIRNDYLLPQLSLQGCTFRDFDSMYYIINVASASMVDCSFQGAGVDVEVIFEGLLISGCRFNGFDRALEFSGDRGSAVLEDVSIVNCTTGLEAEGWEGEISVRNGTFRDIWNTALMITGAMEVRVTGCDFDNVSLPIMVSTTAQGATGAWVEDCSAVGLRVAGIECTGGNLTAANLSLDEHVPEAGWTFGIRFRGLTRAPDITVQVRDVEVTNATHGIAIEAVSFCKVVASLESIRTQRCSMGIQANNIEVLRASGVTITGSELGINVTSTGRVHLDGVEVGNGRDGILLFNVDTVDLGYLDLHHLRGMALDELWVGQASWNLTRPQVLKDLVIGVVSDVTVATDLTLDGVDLELRSTTYDGQGLVVLPGASLTLADASVGGRADSPGYFHVMDGGALVARDSVLHHIGALHSSMTKWGPMLEGGTHDLAGLTVSECRTGLVLMNANATLADCLLRGQVTSLYVLGSNVRVEGGSISGALTALFATSSSVEVRDCRMERSLVPIRAEVSQLVMSNSTVSTTNRVMDLVSASAILHNCSLHTDGTLLMAKSSKVEIWWSDIVPLRAPGGFVEGGEVDLYDTRHWGDWTVNGAPGRVRFLWHHDASAHYRWDGRPAAGEAIVVSTASGETATNVTVGADGTAPRMWLVQMEIEPYANTVHAPFLLTIDREGLLGQATSLGSEAWAGSIEVVDVSPPRLAVSRPSDGGLLSSTSVPVEGTLEEMGSGLQGLEISLDGGWWENVSVTEGRWALVVEAFDGPHEVVVRARDMDGNEVRVASTFSVDTVAPLLGFTDPKAGAAFTNTQVTLRGLVVLDDGSGILRLTVDGSDIHLSENGTFEVSVSLRNEGEVEFLAEAWDAAGNRGEARLVLLRDTQAPVVTVDPLPALTNRTALTLSGNVSDLTRVDATLNGRFVPLTPEGRFAIDLNLSLGVNHLSLEFTDAVGNSARQRVLLVMDNLINGTIVYPRQGEALGTTRVEVEVETDPGVWVRVRGHTEWTMSLPNGTLVAPVDLPGRGQHSLLVEFRDAAGNTLVRAVDVTVRAPPEDREGTLGAWWLLATALLLAGVVVLALRVARPRSPGPR